MKNSKMKTTKWVLFSMLLTAGMISLLWFQQGCTANYPPITAFVATPTSTPGPVTMTFDGITQLPAGWMAAVNSGPITVPALELSTVENEDSPCAPPCNSLWTGPITFTGLNQFVNVEDDFTATNPFFCAGRTISLYYYLDALPSSGAFGQMYVQDTGYVYKSTAFPTMVSGAWTQVSISTNQPGLNSDAILKFGAQIGAGGVGSNFKAVNIYIDYVTMQ